MKRRNLAVTATLMAGCMAMGITGCSNSSSSVNAGSSTAANADDSTAANADSSSDAENTGSDFDSSKLIYVSTRENGSGTRGAFIELFGIEQKNDAGEKVDMTTEDANVTNSTNVMITTISGDTYSIGYVSMGSLDTSIVKALAIDGVEASVDNIKSGDYKVSRPFNIVTDDTMTELAQDFVDYIMSADGQAIIEANGYIAADDAAEAYSVKEGLSGKVVVGGSSSVTPVMEKLAEAYEAIYADVDIDVQMMDSSTGVTSTIEGAYDIGMASRDLTEDEIAQGVTGTVIATDGVAVIVNKNNPLESLTSEQVMKIYTGEITTWSQVE